MHILCPHCRTRIEFVVDERPKELVCPDCARRVVERAREDVSKLATPFGVRIKRRRTAKDNFDKYLTSKKALSKGGPLDGSSAGDITRWMAVPWQSDTSSCLSAYSAYGGEYLPTFWPARVPNDVLTKQDYDTLQSRSKPVEKKKSQITPTVQGAIVEAQPNAQHNPTPIYPELARARGWEGLLVLKVKVEKDGKPSLIQLEQSSGHKILDRSAIRAIKKMDICPGPHGQKESFFLD